MSVCIDQSCAQAAKHLLTQALYLESRLADVLPNYHNDIFFRAADKIIWVPVYSKGHPGSASMSYGLYTFLSYVSSCNIQKIARMDSPRHQSYHWGDIKVCFRERVARPDLKISRK